MIDPVENAEWLMDHPQDGDIEVVIPGTFLATYREGEIVRWTFLPAASDAGYSGPAAVYDDDQGVDLAVDDVDGPFWKAVQNVLGPVDGRITVVWEE